MPRPLPPVRPGDVADPAELADRLVAAGVRRGQPVALVVADRPDDGPGVALAAVPEDWSAVPPTDGAVRTWTCGDGGDGAGLDGAAVEWLAEVQRRLRPRWVWWSARGTAEPLVRRGLRPATCWDLAAVHRLLAGGAADSAGVVWAVAQGLDVGTVPRTGQLDLLGEGAPTGPASPGRPGPPVVPESSVAARALDADGHLRAEWVDGGWCRTSQRLAAWAALALQAGHRQVELLADRARSPEVGGDPVRTAYAESAAALLCVELAHDGLPMDRIRAELLVAEAVGPRPRDGAHEVALRRERDERVLRHLPGEPVDLRNPLQVRAALGRVGIDLPDTRSWRLEPWRGQHPFVAALLDWRKADRVATTYGYSWLDRFVGEDGRLRGPWQASDGAGGRMTAGAGLHNLPAELRPAVAAEPGQLLVRADLGQVEPRVLAAVSGDRALATATAADDLYAPVAARLGVDRPVAKVAVLAAMYGQTSGTAGAALRGLERAYPVAMAFLRRAHEAGRAGRAVVTFGGRRVPMWVTPPWPDPAPDPGLLAGQGRFARNAVVQGAAAELFKAWAVTVRHAAGPLGARVVLCLHDELLVHVPAGRAPAVVDLLRATLDDVGRAWAPTSGVRFVADVRVVQRWSEAKD